MTTTLSSLRVLWEVRRMIEALDAKGLKLVRVKIGPISIGTLQIGNWRLLTEAEVRSLRG